jgi:hypothetical protein
MVGIGICVYWICLCWWDLGVSPQRTDSFWASVNLGTQGLLTECVESVGDVFCYSVFEYWAVEEDMNFIAQYLLIAVIALVCHGSCLGRFLDSLGRVLGIARGIASGLVVVGMH